MSLTWNSGDVVGVDVGVGGIGVMVGVAVGGADVGVIVGVTVGDGVGVAVGGGGVGVGGGPLTSAHISTSSIFQPQ